jgi:transcriptional regulator with XRE-family HTH domain
MQINSGSEKDKHLKQLGERLKQLRRAKGFSNYEQFAYTYEIGRAQYGRYEKGSNISIKTLLKIIEFHGLTLKEFFAEGFDE